MTAQTETLFDNAAWPQAAPRLSVLIPFKGDDPLPLLAALALEPCAAEIVILDDGSDDPALAAEVEAATRLLPLPAQPCSGSVKAIRLSRNCRNKKGHPKVA